MSTVLQDLRYALRSLVGAPLYTAVALLTLAVGIGANAAIFGVVNGVLLRPLAYEAPDELFAILTDNREASSASWPDVLDWRERTDLFAGVAASVEYTTDVQWDGEAEHLTAGAMTAGSIGVLGVDPLLGRDFSADEDRLGGPRAVLISEGLWRSRFGSDPQVAGRTMSIGGDPHTVVGVLPASFVFPDPGLQFWTALREAEAIEEAGFNRMSRTIGFVRSVARLGPGVSADGAARALEVLARQTREAEGVTQDPPAIRLQLLHDRVVGGVRGMMLLVFGAVGLVLLVASANLAGLALNRAASRERELAVRRAMGASGSRLAGQLVVESVVLAVAGGALGLGLAVGLTGVLTRLAPPGLPRLDQVGVDGSVLGFAVALSLVTGLATGLLPALQASRPDVTGALQEGARGSSPGRNRLQRALVVSQVAVAVALVTGAALLLNSFTRLSRVDLGFEAQNLVRVGVTLPSGAYEDSPARVAFYDQVLERVRGLPGVSHASANYSPPLAHNELRQTVLREGEEDTESAVWAGTVIVQSDYFATAGVRLVRGRTFDDGDRAGDPPVVVVNETMARTLWPGADPLGQRFGFAGGIQGSVDQMSREFFPREPFTVVGVVEDVRRSDPGEPPVSEFYRPHTQMGWGSLALLVRTSGDAPAVVPAVRQAVWELDGRVAVDEAVSMGQAIARSVAAPRFRTLLMAGFAGVACLLAMLGVYAIMASAVARRTREIGIRMALGAPAARVRREVMAGGLRLSAWGVVLGLAGAALASRVLVSVLFQVSPTDPLTFVAVAAGVTAVAALAAYLPARRASRVDPVRAIQVE